MKRSIWAGLCLGLAVLLQMSCASAESTIPAPPSGNLRYSITVTEFKNEAGWQGKWSVGDGMQTAMTNLLHES
ncbi:MAG: hypothetical protein KKA76_12875, partial [Proteobacteria bacterium]|nr:hypothetical protein [Pseudomonadota bacterium]